MLPILANLFRQGQSLCLLFGKSIVIQRLDVTIKPFWADLRQEPAWGHLGQGIESVLEGSPHQFETIEAANRRHDIRRVGSLALARSQPATSFEVREKNL